MYIPQAAHRILTLGCLCLGFHALTLPTLANPSSTKLSGYSFSIETSNGAICRYGQNDQPALDVSVGANSNNGTGVYMAMSLSIPLHTKSMATDWCEELAAQEQQRGVMDRVMALNDMGLLTEAELKYWKEQLLPIPEGVVLDPNFTFEEGVEEVTSPVSCIGECPTEAEDPEGV
ncbi:MAG: hypothetical protein OHK0012_22730 [Synechococcales cyanobacterium]